MERNFMENVNEVSRRSVLCGLAVLTLGLLPDSAIAAGKVQVLASGKVEIALASNPELKKVGGVVQFQDGNGRQLALVRTGSGASAYKAIDLSCTHQGVTVNQNGSEWLCPAHGSRFAINGKLLGGKARSDLRSVAVKVSGTKVIVG